MPLKPPIFRQRGAREASRQATQDYERRRGSARQRGYTTKWDKAAKLHLAAHPLCVGCEARGKPTPATRVDHVIRVELRPDLFWVRGNWQGLCATCDSQVKQRLDRLFERGAIAEADLHLGSECAITMARRLGL